VALRLMILAAALGGCGPKQAPTSAMEGGGRRPPERPLLAWTVARDGVAPSTLVGTCHLQVPIERWLPPPHDRALDEARVVYTEVGVMDLDPMLFFQMLDDSQSLRAAIGREAFDTATRMVRDADIMAPLLDVMPAWVAFQLVEGRTSGVRLSAYNSPGTPLLDLAIAARAENAGVQVVPLETLDEQMAMLGEFDAMFEEALVPGSEVSATHAEHFDQVIGLCSTFAVEGVEQMLAEPDPTGFDEALITRRNHAWMAVLVPELAQGNALVAVGAAHLLGEEGLLALLRTEGFTVERLSGRGGVVPREVPAVDPGDRVPDPDTVDLWTTHFQGTLTDVICAPDGLLLTCGLVPSAQACKAEIAQAASMCVAQWGDLLPPDGAANDIADDEVLPCMISGPLIRGIKSGSFGDAPICVQVRTAMEEALAELSDNMNQP